MNNAAVFLKSCLCIFIQIFVLTFSAPPNFCFALEKAGSISPLPDEHSPLATAEFWTGLHPAADQVVLNPAGIAAFNKRLQEQGLIKDLLARATNISAADLNETLSMVWAALRAKTLYDREGSRISQVFFTRIEEEIGRPCADAKIKGGYGFVVVRADLRLLPTDEIATEKPHDFAFDELQNSSLDVGAPLVVAHQSKSGEWLFVYSPTCSGWVKKENVVFCLYRELKDFLQQRRFAVVISAKCDLFLDKGKTIYVSGVRMGAKFPLVRQEKDGWVQIVVPDKKENGNFYKKAAYVRCRDVNIGYLAYTPRNILRQAFELLGAAYGWGGVNGEQDCSSFLQEVFLTVGISLPRNSADQARAGTLVGSFNEQDPEVVKIKSLAQAPGAITILQLKGHVMLYLGMHEGRPYVIHETSGYYEKVAGRDIKRVLNRAVVSDLSLGQGSHKGSLLERLLKINVIK